MTLHPPHEIIDTEIIEPVFEPRRGLASFTDEELAQLDDLPDGDGEPLETLWHVYYSGM